MINSRMLQEILGSIQKSVKCPKCNSSYSDKNINLLGQIGPNFLLSLDCQKCQFHLMVNVLVQENIKNNGVSGIKMEEVDIPFDSMSEKDFDELNKFLSPQNFQNLKPINVNQVIDFANLIKNFKGSFSNFFKNLKN
ncbi:MAG: hypothetical protein Fur0024_3950 [Patescibacteria group bacterium]